MENSDSVRHIVHHLTETVCENRPSLLLLWKPLTVKLTDTVMLRVRDPKKQVVVEKSDGKREALLITSLSINTR